MTKSEEVTQKIDRFFVLRAEETAISISISEHEGEDFSDQYIALDEIEDFINNRARKKDIVSEMNEILEYFKINFLLDRHIQYEDGSIMFSNQSFVTKKFIHNNDRTFNYPEGVSI